MLSVFSLYNGIQPPYTAAFIIELWSSDRYTITLFNWSLTIYFPHSGYFVKFYYRNQTSSDVIEEIYHPDCKRPCSLDKLTKYVQFFIILVVDPTIFIYHCLMDL